MTQAKAKPITFDDYLANDDGPDARCELSEGALVEVPPESDDNITLAMELYELLKTVVNRQLIRIHASTLEVPALAGIDKKNRYPDLMVLTPELASLLKGQSSAIRMDMPAPALVVECVSPYKSTTDDNYRRDYQDKRLQYEHRKVPEYWILDPIAQQVTVLVLIDNRYQKTVFKGEEWVISAAFPTLKVKAANLLMV